MDARQHSTTRFEELDAPVAEVRRVKGRVAHVARDPATFSLDPIGPLIRPSRSAVLALGAVVVALAIGDDGPWIVLVPAVTALCGAWLDRRIPFSFAEGFIGYCGDPEPVHRMPAEEWPVVRSWPARAAS